MTEQSQEALTDSAVSDHPQDLGGLAKEKLGEFFKIPSFSRRSAALVLSLAVFAWASTGLYKVQPDEQGVILRFGRWVETTQPGLHFHLPWPIETALLPRVTQVNQLQLGAAGGGASREKQMLTGDENIVEADCAIVWQIKDAGLYLFKVAEPETALRIAAESALREVIARTPIQAALSDRRQQIADETRNVLQKLLDSEQAGISVMQVQLQRVDPPTTVIDAFNDVQRARADQERARNEAEAYANDILPRARGEAERIRQEAEAYRAQAVNLAEGDAKNFLSVYQSYAQAKEVTAWRLYLESVDEALRKSSKVIIDSSGKGVASVQPFLPLTETRTPATSAGAPK
ncbi:membrane protease subunit HflK [Rhodoblastus acidophilus]|uniref:FtsH protease activity modulator HflK n=1 Tax=Rhodoblastus acidophilus TaxID=1074 RepID=UPI0022244167|nr:FtsH protease activity modulator HflK [Rhodoblastus acidophilus]MCW2285175.1 membrane protease subunit HflK [Rhodoblastus acidophilus]MCW2334131.1 membrane protease subunit HflK [Rhodoblastus acidophilus]